MVHKFDKLIIFISCSYRLYDFVGLLWTKAWVSVDGFSKIVSFKIISYIKINLCYKDVIFIIYTGLIIGISIRLILIDGVPLHSFYNRGIKILRTIKTKLPLQFCVNSLVTIIGQLGLVWLTNKKTKRKHVNKLISRRLLIYYFLKLRRLLIYFIFKLPANSFVYMLSFSVPIGPLNKP